MENQNSLIPFADVAKMATVICQSGFFGIKNQSEALALMLIAQAEGRHPASIAQEYHIIQGKPALKADAMLSRYFAAGGKVRWKVLTDAEVTAIFTHPSSGDVTITWDTARAQAAQLLKPGGMFLKYPRQMLRARVISEGVRTSFPGIIGGFYTPEEVSEFTPIETKGTHTILPAPDEAKTPAAEPKPPTDTETRKLINLRAKAAMDAIGWSRADLEAFAQLRDKNWQTWEMVPNDMAESIVTDLEQRKAEK